MAQYEDDADDRLMERAAGGDTEAFDQIVRRHQARVQRFATRMLGGDSAHGADIVVGVFLRLWEGRRSYRPCGRLESWLLRTTNRLCLDALAARRPTDSIGRSEAAIHPTVEDDALARAVREAVTELPAIQRNVLILSVYEEMSYDEISNVLEIPAGTVASRKNHALAALRRQLAALETKR